LAVWGPIIAGREEKDKSDPSARSAGAELVVKGNLEAALHLAAAKVKGGGSPGGIRTLVTTGTLPYEYRLQGRRERVRGATDTLRGAVVDT